MFAIFRRSAALAALSVSMALGAPALAETSVVVDVSTGKVLSQNGASDRWYPASTTKLMTAYIAFRMMEAGEAALDTPIVMTRDAAQAAPSKMGYEAGSVMRLDNALRMIMVKSANDVAVAIGETLAGSHDAFVARMNAEAARLGMRDTRFINPNGLPGEGQHSSAKDLAILGMTIRREFPAFTDYFSTEAISAGDTIMRNGNDLIGQFAGADGMKTGYICASGFNVVASATREGRTLVAVVLGADGPITRARTAAALLETGFDTDAAIQPLTIDQLPVSSGEPADISDEICSAEGRTARANEREKEAEREEAFGSPYMTELDRPRVTVPVMLGGAAGTDTIEAGISLIAAYGIPIPTWRPVDGPVAAAAASDAVTDADELRGSTVEQGEATASE
ncbi:D-alanyl-D-alanine carboxypeptidase family protein [Aureimonas mangrovi]|uniref:D-alanyl-D-alanine carboxypeptidase family protein n=1 Tax=Aureimonas mangrovi TaxID=2758041 RepID=UPI00163DBE44|nr:D-alanyl-D-alanine carboxypeptidase family protein [Aureimonas mangrovi]